MINSTSFSPRINLYTCPTAEPESVYIAVFTSLGGTLMTFPSQNEGDALRAAQNRIDWINAEMRSNYEKREAKRAA